MNKDEIAKGPSYSVHIFRTGQCRVAGQFAYKNYARDVDHLFTIYITVIRGNGICALIDTGMVSVEEMNRNAGFLFTELITQGADESTEAILKRAGVTPNEVDYIFFTHCHYDHCSNAILFPNAQIVIPETAWKAWHEDSKKAIYLHSGFLDYLNDLHHMGRVQLMDEGIVVPGIGVRRVGGHSVCSQFIYVNTVKGVAVFTGDTVQMYGNIEQNDIIHICEVEQEGWQALDIAKTTADFVVPGHDPRVLERYPDGIVAE